MTCRLLGAIALAIGGAAAATAEPSLAAGGTDNCTGYITSLPHTVLDQGVWCLSADLTDAATDGKSITIATNNVTLDCNGHALIQTSGDGNGRTAISAFSPINLTVRGCDIRGYMHGIVANGGSGHLVEDNRFQHVRLTAVKITDAPGSLVRRNRFEHTGGSSVSSAGAVVSASADILDNVIDGIVKFNDASGLTAISATANDSEVARNVIRGFDTTGAAKATGINASGARVVVAGNQIVAAVPMTGFAIVNAGSQSACTGNRTRGFDAGLSCTIASDNLAP